MMKITNVTREDCIRVSVLLSVVALTQVLAADAAFAQSASSAFSPLQTSVQMVVDFVNGPFGRLLATLAIMGLGFLAFAGRLSWMTAGAVLMGIAFVFGAPNIVNTLISSVGK